MVQPAGQQIKILYSTWALHSEYLTLLNHGSIGHANAPQCYVIGTLLVLFALCLRRGLVKSCAFQSSSDTTISLFHRFRLDGIERSPGVVESPGVLPFAVRGPAFYKHRLVLRYLVPANNYLFPNESLSQVEMVITNNDLHYS